MRISRWVIQVAFFAPAAGFVACAADAGDVAKTTVTGSPYMPPVTIGSSASSSSSPSGSGDTAPFPTFDSGSTSPPPTSGGGDTSSGATASTGGPNDGGAPSSSTGGSTGTGGSTSTGAATSGGTSSATGASSSARPPPVDASTGDASVVDAAPCTTCAVELKYQYATNTGSDPFTIDIINNGPSPISLATLTVRYYFAPGGTSGWTYFCDSAQIKSPYRNVQSYVKATFAASGAKAAGAAEYLEIAFAAGAPSLAPNETAEVQNRFADQASYTLNQANDYSYEAAAGTTFVDNKKITVYLGGKLVWGTEPM